MSSASHEVSWHTITNGVVYVRVSLISQSAGYRRHNEAEILTHSPGLSAMCKVDFALVLGSELLELLMHELYNTLGDTFDGEIRNQSNREFA